MAIDSYYNRHCHYKDFSLEQTHLFESKPKLESSRASTWFDLTMIYWYLQLKIIASKGHVIYFFVTTKNIFRQSRYSLLPLRPETLRAFQRKRSSFLKNPIYLQITIYFVTSIIQFHTFAYIRPLPIYANLRIPFAIFRIITKIVGHTIAKIQHEMRNTLKKK